VLTVSFMVDPWQAAEKQDNVSASIQIRSLPLRRPSMLLLRELDTHIWIKVALANCFVDYNAVFAGLHAELDLLPQI
jgi:hypothetical protein